MFRYFTTTHSRTVQRIRDMSRSISFMRTPLDRNRINIPDRLDIRLTDVESQLCVLLDDCTKQLAQKGVHTSCRIAGGWVRDKVGTSLLSFQMTSTTCSY
jgi:hypothetical protein